jgi:hypothetical protein
VAGHVDLDLVAEVLDRQRLQRARDGDAGIVDEPVEPAPASASIRAAAAAICSASVMSMISAESCPEAASRSASPSSGLRTPAKTVQPAASRRSALARPIPVEAPVTRTDRIAIRLQADRRNLGGGDRDDA